MFRQIEKKIEYTLKDQFGFRKNIDARETILTLRIVIEKELEKIN